MAFSLSSIDLLSMLLGGDARGSGIDLLSLLAGVTRVPPPKEFKPEDDSTIDVDSKDFSERVKHVLGQLKASDNGIEYYDAGLNVINESIADLNDAYTKRIAQMKTQLDASIAGLNEAAAQGIVLRQKETEKQGALRQRSTELLSRYYEAHPDAAPPVDLVSADDTWSAFYLDNSRRQLFRKNIVPDAAPPTDADAGTSSGPTCPCGNPSCGGGNIFDSMRAAAAGVECEDNDSDDEVPGLE